MPGAERAVAHHRRRHDVPAAGLRHLVGGDLAAGQRAVGEVPQRPLAADRLVDALRAARRRWRSRRRASRCSRRPCGPRRRSCRRAAAREPPGDRRGRAPVARPVESAACVMAISKVRGRRIGRWAGGRSSAHAPAPPPTTASEDGLRRLRLFFFGGSRSSMLPPLSLTRKRERAQLGVADDRHRARVDVDALEQVEVHAERIGDDGLDDVAVAAGEPRRVGTRLGGDLRVPLAQRRDRAGLGVAQRLAFRARERRPRSDCVWTTFHSGSFASTLSSWPVQSP